MKLLLFLIYLKNGFKFKLFFLLFFLLVLIGCSPGMFFDNPVDQEVLNSVHYRKYNSECSGMPFSSSVLSVLDFRNLVNCFSGGKQGGEKPSPPFQRLIDSLSDADLSTLVDVFNDLILNDKTKLYRIEQTFNALKQKKIGLFYEVEVGIVAPCRVGEPLVRASGLGDQRRRRAQQAL